MQPYLEREFVLFFISERPALRDDVGEVVAHEADGVCKHRSHRLLRKILRLRRLVAVTRHT